MGAGVIDVALSIGHTPQAPGARYLDSHVHEYHWNAELAPRLGCAMTAAGLSVATFQRDEGPYTAAMRKLCDAINAARPRLVLELHFNAGGGSGAMGVHWPGSSAGQRAARILATAAATAIGIPNRGAVPQARSWNGPVRTDEKGKPAPGGPPLYLLQLTAAPAVILEPFFGDRAGEAEAATRARDDGRLSAALAAAVVEVLG